jgi:hypothetical protein
VDHELRLLWAISESIAFESDNLRPTIAGAGFQGLLQVVEIADESRTLHRPDFRDLGIVGRRTKSGRSGTAPASAKNARRRVARFIRCVGGKSERARIGPMGSLSLRLPFREGERRRLRRCLFGRRSWR